MRHKGTLVTWHDNKGFGFIESKTTSQAIFVHISDCKQNKIRPKVGQILTFELVKKLGNKLCAKNATWIGDNAMANKGKVNANRFNKHKVKNSQAGLTRVKLLLLIFSCLLMVLTLFYGLAWQVSIYYLLLSLITILAYGRDKYLAQKNKHRIAEKTLQLLALLGGWPGALYAQQKFRHKSAKLSFKIGLWLMISINLCGLSYFHVLSMSSEIPSFFEKMI